jgi:hypothetical protein
LDWPVTQIVANIRRLLSFDSPRELEMLVFEGLVLTDTNAPPESWGGIADLAIVE